MKPRPPAASPRSRRLLRSMLVLLLAAAAIALLASAWLLRSGGGRDFALARVLAALPADSLHWERAEGTLGGPLVLRGVRYMQGDVRVEVDVLTVDAAPLSGLARTLQLDALQLDGVRVVLPPADPTAPRWPRELRLPAALPELRLPLALRFARVGATRVSIERDGAALLRIDRLEGSLALAQGRLQVPRLTVHSDQGEWRLAADLDSAADWRGHAMLEGALPIAGRAPLPLTLRVQGDLQRASVAASAALEPTATLEATLSGGLSAPQWQATLRVPRLDPARLGAEGLPLELALQGQGTLAQATLQGRLVRDGVAWVLEPSSLGYGQAALQFAPLVLATPHGTLRAEGTVALGAAAPVYELQLRSDDAHWSPGEGQPEVQASFEARLAGPRDDYALRLDGQLERGDQDAALSLAGRGDARGLRLERFGFDAKHGRLRGDGELSWGPVPRWEVQAELVDLDPSWWLGALPGAIDGQLASRGELREDGVRAQLALDPLGGTLRERSVSGMLEVDFAPQGGEARADLGLGGSRLRGEARWDQRVQGTLQLAPLQLADLWPGAAGTLEGHVSIEGPRAMPLLQARLEGRDLAASGFSAATLQLDAGRTADGVARVALEVAEPAWGGQRFERLRLQGEGRAQAHRATLMLEGAPAALRITLQGGGDEQQWRGTLAALEITPSRREAWRLQAPAALAWNRATGELSLERSCLGDGRASLCALIARAGGRSEAEATLQDFGLAAIDPFLAAHFDLPLAAHGTLRGTGRFVRDNAAPWKGVLRLESEAGGVRLDPEAPRTLFDYRDFVLEAELDAAQARLSGRAALGADGRASLVLRTDAPQAGDGALEGRLELALRDLGFLELASDRLVAPKGRIDAALAFGGTRRAPALEGEAALAGFAAEVPELGLELRDGGLRLRSRGAGRAALEGELTSGGGTVRLAGDLDLRADADPWLALKLTGRDFAAAALPELGAVVSPDLTLARHADRWALGGRIEVPSANLNLERLQAATQPSSDVVVVDEERSARAAGDTVFEGDVELVLGEKVRLQGFGLKGRLEGRLTVRERPGRATVARGALQVSGNYKAYGQDLEITRGRLAYASTPLDDPALDVRAQREVDEVTVGVQVRGTARAPELTLWSDPALDQAEQLSYLVLGRPMRSATQADGARLSQAAAAFGGNLLAQKLGARMGLDEVGVSDSQALGGAALTVGKFLSPRLYVSYGVGLFESGQVVTFKYLINRLWSVQIDSGSENRAALNYRLER